MLAAGRFEYTVLLALGLAEERFFDRFMGLMLVLNESEPELFEFYFWNLWAWVISF